MLRRRNDYAAEAIAFPARLRLATSLHTGLEEYGKPATSVSPETILESANDWRATLGPADVQLELNFVGNCDPYPHGAADKALPDYFLRLRIRNIGEVHDVCPESQPEIRTD